MLLCDRASLMIWFSLREQRQFGSESEDSLIIVREDNGQEVGVFIFTLLTLPSLKVGVSGRKGRGVS